MVNRRLAAIACPFVFAASATLAHAGAAEERSLAPEFQYQVAMEAYSERDFRKTIRLLRMAAANGHLRAQETLGILLLDADFVTGGAVRSDRCESMQWFERAAAQGSEISQNGFLLLYWKQRNLPLASRCR